MSTTRRTAGGVQRLDYKEAEQMLRAGATQKQVAEHYGVTPAAVSAAISRGNISADSGRLAETGIPWSPIRTEHQSKYLAKMLRAAARRRAGKRSAAVTEAMLDAFLASMEEEDAVVHYEPDTEEGFFRVPRRPGIDTWLVRDPRFDDDGNEVAGFRRERGRLREIVS